jgi:hypothetical protein
VFYLVGTVLKGDVLYIFLHNCPILKHIHMSQKAPFNFIVPIRPFICPHVSTLLPLDRFS